jgi:hypothetical protein
MKTIKESILSSTKSGKTGLAGKLFIEKMEALSNLNYQLRKKGYKDNVGEDLFGNKVGVGDLVYMIPDPEQASRMSQIPWYNLFGIVIELDNSNELIKVAYSRKDEWHNKVEEIKNGKLSFDEILDHPSLLMSLINYCVPESSKMILIKSAKDVSPNTLKSIL